MLESSSENEEEEGIVPKQPQPELNWGGVGGEKKVLRKQISMRDTMRELKWEKKKKLMHLRSLGGKIDGVRSLTDEDLDELKGSLELGFGFNEENGGRELCRTLPALELYFAVNRQFSDPNMQMSTPSPASTPTATATSSATSSASTLYGTPSPRSPYGQPKQEPGADGWKLINPGDSPEDVKTKLRHWAKAVACSVRYRC
ncbi:uncharacterized protein LOC110097795 [Dendrobium catenatum]|uniref:Uncharacterized protein n=1 Tax=Dendrobium catenatum TaxID=906689 RepID=A0A2I0WGH8_9ASPA|nr:uncharacterized protein LOC110097795 [Dendrobium catenatum]PKU74774.1 hypothetical protein MA16_Dca004965 [Dendrobium catenatum]